MLLDGRYEIDGLGPLVLSGLTVRQVELLRTYLHFFRQLVDARIGRCSGNQAKYTERLVHSLSVLSNLANFTKRF